MVLQIRAVKRLHVGVHGVGTRLEDAEDAEDALRASNDLWTRVIRCIQITNGLFAEVCHHEKISYLHVSSQTRS